MIKKNNQSIPLKVIQTNNKHTYVKPQNGYLEIRLSKYTNIETIKKRLLLKFDKYYTLTKPINDNQLYVWNQLYTLDIQQADNDSYKIENGIIKVYSNKDIKLIKDLILEQELIRRLHKRLPEINKIIIKEGYDVVPIKLKKLKSKYGSYHLKKHEITLNTHLASYDVSCLDYVIYHEYTHQKHPHHQTSFYAALKKLYPTYKQAQKALKINRIY